MRSNADRRALSGSRAVCAAGLIAVLGSANAQPTYDILDVGDLGNGIVQSDGYGMNNLGWVVGVSQTVSQGPRGFVWNPGTGIMTPLAVLPGSEGAAGGVQNQGLGINDAGVIVGIAPVFSGSTFVAMHAAKWNGAGSALDLTPGLTRSSRAVGISAMGEVFGTVTQANQLPLPTIWRLDGTSVSIPALPGETFTLLAACSPTGEALGQYQVSGSPFWGSFVLRADGTRVTLPIPAGHTQMTPTAINASGVAVGSLRVGTNGATKPWIWTAEGGTRLLPLGANTQGAATAINGAGVVVGWVGGSPLQAAMWMTPDSNPVLLSSRVAQSSSTWGIIGGEGPAAINDSGWILITGLTPPRPGRYQHAAVMVPVNPCPIFTDQPDSRSFNRCTRSLSLGAAAGARQTITYRWRREGQEVSDGQFGGTRIRGSQTNTLLIENPTPAWAGRWVCVATNACGEVLSEEAVVTYCPIDLTCDDFVDFFDFAAFVDAFEAGLPLGDFDGDGFVDFFDFQAFVGAFEAGC